MNHFCNYFEMNRVNTLQFIAPRTQLSASFKLYFFVKYSEQEQAKRKSTNKMT